MDEECEFHRMIITPHGGLAAGNLASLGGVIPTVRAVIDAVENQALMFRVGREIRFVEDRVGDGEPGLGVFLTRRG